MLLFGAFALIHWIIFSVVLLFVVFTVATFDDSRGWSAMWTVFAVLGLCMLGLKLGYFQELELSVGNIGLYVLYWFAAGLGTAFIYWISNVRRFKERFVANMERHQADGTGKNIDDANLKLSYLRAHSISGIFGRYVDKAVSQMPYQSTHAVENAGYDNAKNELDAYVNKYLPPKFTHFKGDLFWAMSVWPMTLAWLVFHRAFKQIATWLLDICKEVFNWGSAAVFGKF